jgi:hypothetical protein
MIAIALAYFLSLVVQGSWENYWVMKDGQTDTALVIGLHWSGHGNVDYTYFVKEKEYTGYSRRDYRNARYATVEIGGRCPVFFSASHPWLSSLRRPEEVVEALPVVLLGLLFETFAVATLINPKSRWAFRFGSRNMFPSKFAKS